MNKLERRLAEVLAIAMVGDGVVTLLQPKRHVSLWRAGPEPWRGSMQALERRPLITAALGGLEAAAGLWLASRMRLSRS